RIAEHSGDQAGALLQYLHALEVSPGLALEIIPAVLAIARLTGNPDMLSELGGGLGSAAEARSLSTLLTRIGDAGGRYQCDECGLNSVGWYWRCPKCRAWDSMRPAVFKWAERAEDAVRLS